MVVSCNAGVDKAGLDIEWGGQDVGCGQDDECGSQNNYNITGESCHAKH